MKKDTPINFIAFDVDFKSWHEEETKKVDYCFKSKCSIFILHAQTQVFIYYFTSEKKEVSMFFGSNDTPSNPPIIHSTSISQS